MVPNVLTKLYYILYLTWDSSTNPWKKPKRQPNFAPSSFAFGASAIIVKN